MDSRPASRPLILIVRTGHKGFREYLLRSITSRYRVHMMLGLEPSWELEYIDGATVQANTLDTAAMIAAAKRIDADDHISGVLSWDESRTPQVAAIAAALGLPGGDPDVIARCRDKHLTRQALTAAGVAQPRSALVSSLADAHRVAADFGYPIIVKPSDLALSIGVVKAETPEQLDDCFAFASACRVAELPDYRPRVLIEEYVTGEEISVDVAVHRGEVVPLCLAHKEIGYPPYCVEVGHLVHGDDPLLADSVLLDLLRDTHRALGFTDGITHTEIKLSPSGPKIIEVNARLGGDMIPYLGLRATGVDVGLAAASVACGEAPNPTRTTNATAAVRFFHPAEPNTHIESVEFDAVGLPSEVDMLTVLVAPGAIKSPPDGANGGRVAFATAVGSSAAECARALDAAEAALRITKAVPNTEA